MNVMYTHSNHSGRRSFEWPLRQLLISCACLSHLLFMAGCISSQVQHGSCVIIGDSSVDLNRVVFRLVTYLEEKGADVSCRGSVGAGHYTITFSIADLSGCVDVDDEHRSLYMNFELTNRCSLFADRYEIEQMADELRNIGAEH